MTNIKTFNCEQTANKFYWRNKEPSELTREELLEVVDFLLTTERRFAQYSESEETKKLKIENELMKDLILKMSI